MEEEAAETANRRLNGKIPMAGWAHATGVRPCLPKIVLLNLL